MKLLVLMLHELFPAGANILLFVSMLQQAGACKSIVCVSSTSIFFVHPMQSFFIMLDDLDQLHQKIPNQKTES